MFIPGKLYEITCDGLVAWKKDLQNEDLKWIKPSHVLKRGTIIFCVSLEIIPKTENINSHLKVNFLYKNKEYHVFFYHNQKEFTKLLKRDIRLVL